MDCTLTGHEDCRPVHLLDLSRLNLQERSWRSDRKCRQIAPLSGRDDGIFHRDAPTGVSVQSLFLRDVKDATSHKRQVRALIGMEKDALVALLNPLAPRNLP